MFKLIVQAAIPFLSATSPQPGDASSARIVDVPPAKFEMVAIRLDNLAFGASIKGAEQPNGGAYLVPLAPVGAKNANHLTDTVGKHMVLNETLVLAPLGPVMNAYRVDNQLK